MKNVLLLIIFVLFSCKNNVNTIVQKDDNFEKNIFKMNIYKRDNVTEKDFSYAKMIFDETRNKVEQDSLHFTAADYWNLTTAQILLKEDNKENIRYSFKKAFELNPRVTSIMLRQKKEKKKENYKEWLAIIPQIDSILESYYKDKPEESKEVDIAVYCLNNKYDYDLVMLLSLIRVNDQKYRDGIKKYKENLKEQTFLDKENQKKIDSLFKKYENYIGNSLVGKDFNFVMWAVVQHSNIDMMKKYLPIIHQAVKDKELPKGPLKLLIDRIYSIEHGYQIFGSQGGVDLADEEIRKKLIAEYNMDNL